MMFESPVIIRENTQRNLTQRTCRLCRWCGICFFVSEIVVEHIHRTPPGQSIRYGPRMSLLGVDAESVGDIEQAAAAVRRKARSFADRHKGKSGETARDRRRLAASVREFESIHEQAADPCLSARLLYASNTRNHEFVRLYQSVRETWAYVRETLTFFPLELMSLPEKWRIDLLNDENFTSFRRFLLRLDRQKPYRLSEARERAVQRQRLSGKTTHKTRYDSLLGSLTFPVDINGGMRDLHVAQVLAFRNSPDRAVRKRCHQVYMERLEANGAVIGSILNTVVLDHLREDLLRGNPHPMHRRHMANEVDVSVIETMMKAVESHYREGRRYFRLKAGVLGLNRLRTFDLAAPVEGAQSSMRFSSARKHILSAAADFHPLFHSTALSFFENHRIDAEIRRGKLNGAFCLCFGPKQHPVISMNYNGHIQDALVLAHELGHGIHYRLAGRQSYCNFRPPPILEEAASTFMEILLVRHLLEAGDGSVNARTVTAAHLDGLITTVFRQNVITRFEQSLYRLHQDHCPDAEELCGIWRNNITAFFGEDVHTTAIDRWGWAGVPHIIHRPFYCYAYVFGNLIAMALYREFERGGRGASRDIIRLLASGGAEAPLSILEGMGLAPRDAAFWKGAFAYMDGLIDAFLPAESG